MYIDTVKSIEVFRINPLNKIYHKEPLRPVYENLKHKNPRELTPQRSTQFPDILKSTSFQSLAPKFLKRVKPKIVREVTPIRWTMKKPLEPPPKSKSPLRSITPKTFCKKVSSYKKVEIPMRNPLSITPIKDKRDTFVIEEIIEERAQKLLRDKY